MVKQVETTLTQWQAFDGSLFNSQEDAENYEARIANERRVCPSCEGRKVDDDNKPCPFCSGKGYQQRMEVWQ